MQLTPGAATDYKKTNGQFVFQAEPGLKKASSTTVLEGWIALDAQTEQEVQVAQPQSVKKPFLGPIETMLLAGLIVATLARHFVHVGDQTKS